MKSQCGRCGRFCRDLEATTRYAEAGYLSGPVLDTVTAVDDAHGRVDVEPGYEWLSGWSWDDFDLENET